MKLIEILLAVLFIGVAIGASISDLKWGIIPNRLLIFGLGGGIVLNCIYYFINVNNLVKGYIINLFTVIIISILFYGFHVWSAGDSKLCILLVSLLPGRVYLFDEKLMAPAIRIFIFIFSIGFIYVVLESIIIGIKKQSLLSFDKFRFNLKHILMNYIAVSAILAIANHFMAYFFPVFYEDNIMIIQFINLFIIMLLQDKKWVEQPAIVFPLGIIWIAISIILQIKISITWWFFLIIGLVMLLRIFSEKYNYELIKTSEVQPGMILSLNSIIRFQSSRVKGLPLHTTEDLRSRLSAEDVKAILNWEKSKHGEGFIIIVRKLPFASIISISAFLFVFTEVFFL